MLFMPMAFSQIETSINRDERPSEIRLVEKPKFVVVIHSHFHIHTTHDICYVWTHMIDQFNKIYPNIV
jgi:hypothetical protein